MAHADDVLALHQLVDNYASAVDDRDVAAMIGLFVPGGSLIVHEGDEPEPVHRYTGGELAEVIGDMERYYLQTFHFIGNHACQLDGDRATGTPYCVAYHLRDDGRGLQVVTIPVRYRDVYVRTAEGWRFEERVCRLLWRERRAAVQWPPST